MSQDRSLGPRLAPLCGSLTLDPAFRVGAVFLPPKPNASARATKAFFPGNFTIKNIYREQIYVSGFPVSGRLGRLLRVISIFCACRFTSLIATSLIPKSQRRRKQAPPPKPLRELPPPSGSDQGSPGPEPPYAARSQLIWPNCLLQAQEAARQAKRFPPWRRLMQGRPQAAGEKAQARLSPLPEPTVWTRGFATVHLCARASRRVCICKIDHG